MGPLGGTSISIPSVVAGGPGCSAAFDLQCWMHVPKGVPVLSIHRRCWPCPKQQHKTRCLQMQRVKPHIAKAVADVASEDLAMQNASWFCVSSCLWGGTPLPLVVEATSGLDHSHGGCQEAATMEETLHWRNVRTWECSAVPLIQCPMWTPSVPSSPLLWMWGRTEHVRIELHTATSQKIRIDYIVSYDMIDPRSEQITNKISLNATARDTDIDDAKEEPHRVPPKYHWYGWCAKFTAQI